MTAKRKEANNAELPPHPRGKLITVAEAAKHCAVDYDTMLRWIRSGALPFVEVGPQKALRVRELDVEDLIKPGGVEN
jgi:excisionase family DNA binding protein